MAAWGYEFNLLVLKVSLTDSKIKFVSRRGQVISSTSFEKVRDIFLKDF